ncbi:hypothetical protein CD351_10810 [Erythrobacter sp. KY5]|nr:hypothetical protein CD351_10810 [Erythrobacter sp. KY5]
MDWWRMAGVDCDFTDDATDWLGSEAPAIARDDGPRAPESRKSTASEPAPAPKSKITRNDLLGASPPTTLEEFREFWLQTPGLDAIGPRGRVAPRGVAQPELMVIVLDPEERDSDSLLKGPCGQLLGNILRAMGIDESAVYLASSLPRHTPMADTTSIAACGMDAVTAHHIALVAPKRVIAFGSSIPPLIGHELTKDISSLRQINHEKRSVPLMVSEGLDAMMAMPRLKARFWRRWMEWSADL